MTDDLVKRLRNDWTPIYGGCVGTMFEAADRIEKLVEENGVLFVANVRLNSRADLDLDPYVDRIEKLEAALKKIAQHDMQAIAMDALRPGERIRQALDAE